MSVETLDQILLFVVFGPQHDLVGTKVDTFADFSYAE